MAPGGGGKWASPNLQVWQKLVASIWKLTHRGLNKWPTLSRWHFQMKFPNENVSLLINFTKSRGVHLNVSALVQVKKYWLPNRHHAITRTKVNKDLLWHTTSLGHDELNKSTLVQVIGCCVILLPEPKLTKISLTIWHHWAMMSLKQILISLRVEESTWMSLSWFR